MSKGYKPREKDRPPVENVDVDGTGGTGGGKTKVRSWHFSLVDKEVDASLAKVGTPVTGIVKGLDVMVRNGSHYYGFAPPNVAIEIIDFLNGKGTLSGNVTSVSGSGKDDLDVWVRLVGK